MHLQSPTQNAERDNFAVQGGQELEGAADVSGRCRYGMESYERFENHW